MSLYDSLSLSLSSKGLTTSVGNASDGALSGTNGMLGNSMFGKAVTNIGTSMARNAAVGMVNKYVPGSMQKLANAGAGAIGDIMRGDLSNAGLRLLDSGLLTQFLPGMDGVGAQARFFATPTPLFGGISPAEARSIYHEVQGAKHCRKNLWLIEVSSNLGGGDSSHRFNLFATDLEYSPFTVTGEKRKIGAGHVDCVNSSDPVELRITTFDDESGFIKNWFKNHCINTANSDGTVGLPANYAIKIAIVHGFITRDSVRNGYEDVGLFRAGNIDMSLSRREDGLQELQLSFVQLDTFMAP